MNRISPQEVVAAYRKTGLKPITGKWYGGDGSACALTVVAIGRGCMSLGVLENDEDTMIGAAVQTRLVLSGDYVCGFVDAYDRRHQPYRSEAFAGEYHAGFDDGLGASEAVFAPPEPLRLTYRAEPTEALSRPV